MTMCTKMALLLVICLPLSKGLCTNGSRWSFERTTGVGLPETLINQIKPLDVVKTDENNGWHSCHFLCLSQDRCQAYHLDHERGTCLLLNTTIPNHQLTSSQQGTYFRKICLHTEVECGTRLWSFDRVIGMELLGHDDQVLTEVESKWECERSCLELTCRSAEYNHLQKTCSLSTNDRRSSPSDFQANRHVEYLENQCNDVPNTCVYRVKAETSTPYALLWARNVSDVKQCQTRCSQHADFQCRSFVYEKDSQVCRMSADDRFSRRQPFRTSALGADYYERSDCLNVAMKCDANTMTALVTLEYPFQGKVYALLNPNDCVTSAHVQPSDHQVALVMPLKSSLCGTRSIGNGFYSNSIVVQHHPNILRSSDRRIEVVCEYEEHRVRLKAGKHIEEAEVSNISTVVTGVAPTPQVQMRLVDETGNEVDGVDLGSEIFLRVELLDQRIYGIMGSGLVARSGDEVENITLIDDFGCPVESNIFPALKPIPGSKSLQAPFQAFRFASDSTVRFQITISFCLNVCQPVVCETEQELNATSYGRRRRRKRRSVSTTSLPDIVMEGSLKVRGKLELKDTSQTDLHQWSNLNDGVAHSRICTSQSVVVAVSVVAVIGQLIAIMACVYSVCKGRHKLLAMSKCISDEQEVYYQGLPHLNFTNNAMHLNNQRLQI